MSPNPWLALGETTDRRTHATHIARARERALSGGRSPADVRPVILRSWARSTHAGVDPDAGLARMPMTADEAQARWEAHPIGRCEQLLRDLFADVFGATREVVMVCDRDGSVLWRCGHPAAIDAADQLHAGPGSDWSERSVGTNAMGTALVERHALQVFGAEHYTEPVHGWGCSAAPIHHPRTGEVLGVINLAGPPGAGNPHALALVMAAVRMVEAQIAQDERGRAPTGPALRLLNGGRAVLQSGDAAIPLSLRGSEILALLAYRPQGWTAEQLAIALHGDFGKPVSIRVELSRLRRRLGAVIETQPYRLAAGVRVDFLELESLLDAGQADAALDLYGGPLLPGSDVPLINELRTRIVDQVRAGVMDCGDASVVERWLRTAGGHDDGDAIVRLLSLTGDRPTAARYRGRLERLARLGLVSAASARSHATHLLPPSDYVHQHAPRDPPVPVIDGREEQTCSTM